jgi:predicted small lipoprotein YifL
MPKLTRREMLTLAAAAVAACGQPGPMEVTLGVEGMI